MGKYNKLKVDTIRYIKNQLSIFSINIKIYYSRRCRNTKFHTFRIKYQFFFRFFSRFGNIADEIEEKKKKRIIFEIIKIFGLISNIDSIRCLMYTERKNPNVSRISNGKTILLTYL